MTDKREPSFGAGAGGGTPPASIPPVPTPPAPTASTGSAAVPAASASTAARAARPRTPPEDPEAFHRWIEIEKLKVELKKLEFEQQHLSLVAQPQESSNTLAYITLALVAAVVGLLVYIILTLVPLKEEVTRLKAAQAVPAASAPVAAAPASATSTTPAEPKATQTAAAPAASPATAPTPAPAPATPAPDASQAAAPAQETAAAPAEPAAAQQPAPAPYSVRIFATNTADKAKLERFAGVARSAGFTVDVSATEVFQPLRNSLAYHPSVQAEAQKLAKALQAKYPGINLEVKASNSITDQAKNVLILTLMDDAVN